MFSASLDVTPISAPIIQWVDIRPGAAAGPPGSGGSMPSRFRSPAEAFGLFGDVASRRLRTPADDLLNAHVGKAGAAAADVATRAPGKADEIAEQRVVLLARKYAGDRHTTEVVARLEILNARLLALAPRVTEDRVAALENIGTKIAAIRTARLERAKRLGLPA